MRVLILGCSGFIGQHLCQKLLQEDFEVFGLLQDAKKLRLSTHNNFHYEEYLMGEVIPKSVIEFKPTVFINLAWKGIPDLSEVQSLENLKLHLLLICQLKHIPTLRKIISAGSCLEYGDAENECFEFQIPINPGYFGYAKNAIFESYQKYCQEFSIEFIWFRIFFVYGIGQRSGSLMPLIIKSAIVGEAIQLRHPESYNDYINIKDVINGFVLAVKNTNNCSGIYNLGSGQTTKSSRIQDYITTLLNHSSLDISSAKVKLSGDNQGFWASNVKALNILDWKPRVSLEDGIEELIDYYVSRR